MNRLLLWLGLPHRYRSTGCLHGRHDYCAQPSGQAGVKVPARCKFCASRCRCRCHRNPVPAGQPRLWVPGRRRG